MARVLKRVKVSMPWGRTEESLFEIERLPSGRINFANLTALERFFNRNYEGQGIAKAASALGITPEEVWESVQSGEEVIW